MAIRFTRARLHAPASLVSELDGFYCERLGFPRAAQSAGNVAFAVGETVLELCPGDGSPFYHFALLTPGDRFEAALDWARERVGLLPDGVTGDEVFEFRNWDATALYFHDPADNIVELIAHRGIGETGARGPFAAAEVLGLSEIGIVGDPPSLAAELERTLGLKVWDGSLTGEGRLGFVGERARTVILCRAGRPWLPTGRPSEAHPVELVLGGVPEGEVKLAAGGFVRRRRTRAFDAGRAGAHAVR